jgi:hypothetical protein
MDAPLYSCFGPDTCACRNAQRPQLDRLTPVGLSAGNTPILVPPTFVDITEIVAIVVRVAAIAVRAPQLLLAFRAVRGDRSCVLHLPAGAAAHNTARDACDLGRAQILMLLLDHNRRYVHIAR